MLLFERFSAFFFNAETRVQIAFCVMVSCGLLSDFRADCALRYGLLWVVIGLSRSRRSALGSLVVYYRTLVQLSFCVMVSCGRLSDFCADCVLRYCLLWSIIGLSCRLRSALWSLFGELAT